MRARPGQAGIRSQGQRSPTGSEGCQEPKDENRARKEGELTAVMADFSLEVKEVWNEEGGGDTKAPRATLLASLVLGCPGLRAQAGRDNSRLSRPLFSLNCNKPTIIPHPPP